MCWGLYERQSVFSWYRDSLDKDPIAHSPPLPPPPLTLLLANLVPRTAYRSDEASANNYMNRWEHSLRTLGLNTSNFCLPANLITFAYRMQVLHDPHHLATHLDALDHIATGWTGTGKDDLHLAVTLERSKGYYTLGDVDRAYEKFEGLGKADESLIMTDRADFPKEYVVDKVRDSFSKLALESAGSDEGTRKKRKEELAECLDVIAWDRRFSPEVYRAIKGVREDLKKAPLSTQEAYRMLDATEEIDDDLLTT
jgi:hypothetical protein